MKEKFKKSLDRGDGYAALLTDLSKASDCLLHDLIIAKLHVYGFDKGSLRFIIRELKPMIPRAFGVFLNMESLKDQFSVPYYLTF